MRNLHLGLYTPNQGVPKHSGSLFHSTRATTEKKKILEEEFGVAMNEELEREVLVMCNLSQGVKAEGREEGIQITVAIYTQARLRTSLFCFLLYQLSLWWVKYRAQPEAIST